MSELLRVADAGFGYGRRPVISGVNLVLRPGDFYGIVGPNGAGKTTLFRGILGLLRPLEGSVVRGATTLGYVPQRESLDEIFPVTVREVVELGGRARWPGRGRLGREERARCDRLLERVELGDRADRLFSSLSGGQRQRALIARALLLEPELLLLDEPTSGVDRRAEESILRVLRELRDEGIAILLVSHQLGLLRDAVERVLWVSGGSVREGTGRELLTPDRVDQLFSGAATGKAS